MQNFKGDALELKFIACGEPILSAMSLNLDDFLEGCYECAVLGELIWDNELSPVAKGILRDIFRASFSEIFSQFKVAGSFESYISVFKKIFGDDVDITFTVPAPGKLIIDIETENLEITNWVAREVVSNRFEYDQMITLIDGDHLVFETVKGFTSQYELEQMLFEMVPAGIFAEINLTLG